MCIFSYLCLDVLYMLRGYVQVEFSKVLGRYFFFGFFKVCLVLFG